MWQSSSPYGVASEPSDDSTLALPVLYLPCPICHCSPTRDSSHVNQTSLSWRACSWPPSRPLPTLLDVPGSWTCLTLARWSFCCSCLSSDLCPLANHPGIRWNQNSGLTNLCCWGLGKVPPQSTMHIWKNTSIHQEIANMAYPLPQNLTPKGKYFR